MKNHVLVKRLLDGAIIVTLFAALTQTASAKFTPLPTPDASSTSLLLGIGCAGLAFVRKFRR